MLQQQCERYVKNLILIDIYPQKRNSSATTSTAISSTTFFQSQQLLPSSNISKSSTYGDFIAACEDEDVLIETSKEKSRRILISEELKYLKMTVPEFNVKHRPSTTSALDFWKNYYVNFLRYFI
jgi:hypothetical protein